MTRTERKWHYRAWLILTPIVAVLLVLALIRA